MFLLATFSISMPLTFFPLKCEAAFLWRWLSLSVAVSRIIIAMLDKQLAQVGAESG